MSAPSDSPPDPEPDDDPALVAELERWLVLAPHVGSATRQTREAMTRVLVDNLLAAAGGRALPSPVAVPA